ncbi:diguanylate cyclase (GGDEF)-like protein/PAS domain S-box-containing protein [Natronobacillus azotifigens]|uniref:EAL domain-containing protein n=1 Tax=Natronobacillus azotifigens TaxID=472978 RepID=A0A9J6R7N7_9BACI|nr:EAL domain-containing protein [Natronobacillus azotifigens]
MQKDKTPMMKDMFEHFAADHENVWHLFSNTNDGLIITNSNNRIIMVNPAFSTMSGYTFDELYWKTPSFFQSGQTSLEVFQDMWGTLKNNNTWTGELINRRKNGSIFYSFLTITFVENKKNNNGYYIGIARDVTEEKEEQKRIQKLAYYDFLTKLPNRSYFQDLVTQKITETPNQRMALLFFDLDRFKLINDTLGHLQGDVLLVDVAKRLKKIFANEGLVGRFGGDEFVIFLPNASREQCVSLILENCFADFRDNAFKIDEKKYFMTASVGISFYPDHGTNVESLVKNADNAMYRLKSETRNSYLFFHDDMGDALMKQLILGNELRQAQEKQEFVLYYQFQMDLIKNKISGVEALIRWNHPSKGLLTPNEFLGEASEIGMIAEIDDWVMKSAFCEMKRWHKKGYLDLEIAINISKQQFERASFVECVNSALVFSQINPATVCLEITENIALNDIEESVEKIKQLKDLGVKVALDDFGTGYSSLSQLKNFPVDVLKIDPSFMIDSSGDDRDAALVKTIIHMAKLLGYAVVCEGIETADQLNFIREEQCDYAQGYFIGRPVPVAQLEKILVSSKLNRVNV